MLLRGEVHGGFDCSGLVLPVAGLPACLQWLSMLRKDACLALAGAKMGKGCSVPNAPSLGQGRMCVGGVWFVPPTSYCGFVAQAAKACFHQG
jgi:hypothetical protein